MAGTPDASRCWNRQRQSPRKRGKPSLLMFDQESRCRPPGQTDGEVVTQAKEPVVPTFADVDELQMREVRMLLQEQRPNERRVDLRLPPAASVRSSSGAITMMTSI